MNIRSLDVLTDVTRALAEDLGSGDVTSALLPLDKQVKAEIISREPMLLCGRPWCDAVFKTINANISLQWLVAEGEWLSKGAVLCRLQGPAVDLLIAERTALNFVQTLSGTATTTYHYVQAIAGTQTRLLDTRKTLPGLRLAQKYAVVCGGGVNHRIGLYDAYLIKENHIKACGSVKQAIETARTRNPFLFLEIEVETLAQLKDALETKPDRILLDNFTLEWLQDAVKMNQAYGCQLEASGGIHLNNISTIAKTGVDFISVGELTKSLKAIDLSMLIL
ncbi:MAG: nicotinate-nucleotide diphosphorylase (carboxylating) [Legionellales bacterium RIFCSPHIGHO2_12_FULL_42_9]|nr:MAG: nicotinate-nucleotide diphosphorylase (carboxylating) [Legionellales bacterium RIFCSPHIGHO2_12_FULL_42_9]